MVLASYDAGIQTFDTANVYSNGESERILGKAIKKYNLPRDEIVVMTKVRLIDSLQLFNLPNDARTGYRCSSSAHIRPASCTWAQSLPRRQSDM